MQEVSDRIEHARMAAGLSQRTLAQTTGIPQATLSRIIAGQRAAKMPELVAIAQATGHTVAELSGSSVVAERAESAARATCGASMQTMRQHLVHYLELDAYLEDQGIPAALWWDPLESTCRHASLSIL